MSDKFAKEISGPDDWKDKTFANTDRELWREKADDHDSPSIHVTARGGIGINVGGTVKVRTLAVWHAIDDKLAAELAAVKAENERLAQSLDANWVTHQQLAKANAILPAFEEMEKALEKASEFIRNGVEMGYIKMPTSSDPALDTLPAIESALAHAAKVQEQVDAQT